MSRTDLVRIALGSICVMPLVPSASSRQPSAGTSAPSAPQIAAYERVADVTPSSPSVQDPFKLSSGAIAKMKRATAPPTAPMLAEHHMFFGIVAVTGRRPSLTPPRADGTFGAEDYGYIAAVSVDDLANGNLPFGKIAARPVLREGMTGASAGGNV